jgi:hypothetical protein
MVAATEAALEEMQRKRMWKRVRLSTLASFSFFCYTLSKMNPDDRDAMWARTVAWAENITLSATTAHCVLLCVAIALILTPNSYLKYVKTIATTYDATE